MLQKFKGHRGPKARDAVHVLFAGEKIRLDDPVPAPDVSVSEDIQQHLTLRLDALVRMKLTSFRRKERCGASCALAW